MKEQVLGSLGYSAAETFPVYADRFPLQLLSYLRLSRVQDVGLLAKVSFESDVIISQMNEYEVLQLLMGDCRERLNDYRGTLEEAQKELQAPPGWGASRQNSLVQQQGLPPAGGPPAATAEAAPAASTTGGPAGQPLRSSNDLSTLRTDFAYQQ